MLYSSFSILALLIHFIIHFDSFRKLKDPHAHAAAHSYRRFLRGLAAYYVCDILWGILYDTKILALVYTDTVLYFFFMSFSVFLWCRYAVVYLNRLNAFSKFLTVYGYGILCFEVCNLVINFFTPVFFMFDSEMVYHPLTARMVTLALLVLLFLVTSVYSFMVSAKSEGPDKRHHRVIGICGITMTVFIILQAADAFLPYYAIGCLFATCLVHSMITVDEKKEAQRKLDESVQREKILTASRYDYLTGLPNLIRFFELAENGKEAMHRAGESPVLLYMDLVGMKSFNNRHGFEGGNRLLKAFAGLLADRFGLEQCSHIGADRFAVFTKNDRLEETMNGLFEDARQINGGNMLPIRVGVYPDSMEDVSATVAYDRAKMACDELPSNGGSCYKYYSEELREQIRRRRYIRQNLDRALSEKWIRVYFQPIVRTISGKICNEEALARWIDPVEGFLSPAEFIPYLEDCGLIWKLDLYVVRQVLEKIGKQAESGIYILPHSVNLSRSDFDACDMVEEIRKLVDDSGVPRDRIALEITESTVGSDFSFMKEQIARFRKLGFQVWMDDFGSGYSSPDILQSIHFDLIKFDMSFTRKLDEGDSAKIVLRELMKMATSLGVDTICEGVETESQALFLEEIGCAKQQGYYYSKPAPYEEILERYRSGEFKIGYENPDESSFFDSMGRINLYDLDVIAGDENENAIRNALQTIPMGIIEIKGDQFRFVRSNPSYRDFFRRLLGTDHLVLPQYYIPYHSATMHHIVENCCKQGIRTFYDERMSDGAMAHSFARRIGTNPVTGSWAVAIAVLSVSDPAEGETYADIARVLAADYHNIYVVDLDTEKFIEYSSPAGKNELAMERHGSDFFKTARQDIMVRIYPDDRRLLLTWFTKENVVSELDQRGVFFTTYRLIENGKPVYVQMKIMRIPDTSRIILGVSVVDSRMKRQEQEDRIRKERDTLARVMTITENYISLYSIAPDTGAYIECSSAVVYDRLDVPREGDDFYSQALAVVRKYVFREDLPAYLDCVSKENILRDIREKQLFKIHFRLVLDGSPKNVTLRIIPYRDDEGDKLLAGIRVWTDRR